MRDVSGGDLFAEQRGRDACSESVGHRKNFIGCSDGVLADQHGDLFAVIEDFRGLSQSGFIRANAFLGVSHPGTGYEMFLGGLFHIERLHIGGQNDDRWTAVGLGVLEPVHHM